MHGSCNFLSLNVFAIQFRRTIDYFSSTSTSRPSTTSSSYLFHDCTLTSSPVSSIPASFSSIGCLLFTGINPIVFLTWLLHFLLSHFNICWSVLFWQPKHAAGSYPTNLGPLFSRWWKCPTFSCPSYNANVWEEAVGERFRPTGFIPYRPVAS